MQNYRKKKKNNNKKQKTNQKSALQPHCQSAANTNNHITNDINLICFGPLCFPPIIALVVSIRQKKRVPFRHP